MDCVTTHFISNDGDDDFVAEHYGFYKLSLPQILAL